jgi:membrane protein CcdC involved in cytochrome C biogenesis
MAKKTLSEYTDSELHQKLKQSKMFVGVYLGLLIIMIMMSISSIVENIFNASTLMPLFFIPIFLIILLQKKRIQKELESRKGNG